MPNFAKFGIVTSEQKEQIKKEKLFKFNLKKMIRVKNIQKKFGDLKAVDNISFEVKKGEIVGFLGPNGAGKTTTMRMLTGFLYPDEGEVKIDRKSIVSDTEQLRKKIGYLPENNPLYKDLKVSEILDLVLDLRKVPHNKREKMIDKAVKATGIESVYYRPVDELSKGFKQRVGLAQALVHEPDILILDEPTEGLDPNQRNDIRKLIKKASKEKTIILSTHVMQEVTAMCNRVMIIDKGRIVADSTKDDLTEGKQNIVEFAARGKNIRKELEKIDEIENIKAPPGRPRIKKLEITYTNRDKFFKKLSEAISKNKWTVYKINEKVISLEDIFYELTHGKKQ